MSKIKCPQIQEIVHEINENVLAMAKDPQNYKIVALAIEFCDQDEM